MGHIFPEIFSVKMSSGAIQMSTDALRNPMRVETVPFRGLMAVDRSGKYVKMGRCSFSCGKIQLRGFIGLAAMGLLWRGN